MNNLNQPVNPPETSAAPVSNPVNNQRGLLPIILGVLFLLVVVGGGAYYLGMQNSKTTPTKAPTPTYITPSYYCLSPDCKGPSISIAQPTVSSFPSPSVVKPTEIIITIPPEQVVKDTESIKQALIKRYSDYNGQEINVEINYDDGKYAAGYVVFSPTPGGGGVLLAAKINGVWEFIQVGAQEGPLCAQLTNYPDLPKTLVPACYDENGRGVDR